MPLNANQFRPMYEKLSINLDKLGCVMLDIEGSEIVSPPENVLYYTDHPERFWIKGFVAGSVPHVTLLYGLLDSANTTWRDYAGLVLGDWKIADIEIDHVGYFDSPYTDEEYYCIVAHVKITPELLEGHSRLELLPHINTFPEYKAHITLAYIKKDEVQRDNAIIVYDRHLTGKKLKVTGINYGK